MQKRWAVQWTWRRCFAMMTGAKCAFTAIAVVVYVYHNGVTSLGGALDDFHMNYFGTVNNAPNTFQEAHRRLLTDPHDYGFNSSNGIKATLIHRPTQCSSYAYGDKNSSDSAASEASEESKRVQQLRCALQRSSERVEYFLTRTSARDRQILMDGLPTKYVGESLWDDEDDESGSKFAREVLEGQDWGQSYESRLWSHPGEYLMKFAVGTPPRILTGVVDTGSDLTWLQCSRCVRCYQQSDPIYQPRDSATYLALSCTTNLCEALTATFCNVLGDSCDYMYTYSDRSYTYGTVSADIFSFKSTHRQDMGFASIVFGCSHASRGSFARTHADGVVGLGRGAVSLASQLGRHLTDKFGYCFVRRKYPSSKGSAFYFGDAASLHGPDVGYTPMIVNKRYRAYYYLKMIGVSVGDTRLDIPSTNFDIIPSTGRGGTILDSGTTMSNLEGMAYDALVSAMRARVSYPTTISKSNFTLCFDVRGISNPKFPKLVFHLDGVDLDLPVDNYIMEAEDDILCLSMDRSSDHLTIIGNVQHQNYRVVYDRENDKIGFQPTICYEEE